MRKEEPDWKVMPHKSPKSLETRLAASIDGLLSRIKDGEYKEMALLLHEQSISINDTADYSSASEKSQIPVENEGFIQLKHRTDLDFLDLLWIFVGPVSTREDLLDVLTAAIEEIETGRLMPLVSKDNTSRFASIIRAFLKFAAEQGGIQRLFKDGHQRSSDNEKESLSATFDYWLDANPLECLVDVGIAKLKRDYMFYLSTDQSTSCVLSSGVNGSSYAATSSHSAALPRNLLERVFSVNDASLGGDEPTDYDHQIKGIQLLQRALECYFLLKNNILALSDDEVGSVVQKLCHVHLSNPGWFGVSNNDGSVGDDFKEEKNGYNMYDDSNIDIVLPQFSSSTQKVVSTLTQRFKFFI